MVDVVATGGARNDDERIGGIGLDFGCESDGGAVRGRKIVDDTGRIARLGRIDAVDGGFDNDSSGDRAGRGLCGGGRLCDGRRGFFTTGGKGVDDEERGL